MTAQLLETLVWFGYRLIDRQRYEWTPSREAVDSCIPLRLFAKISRTVFASPHGIIFGTAIRWIPMIDGANWGLVLRWHRRDRSKYSIALIRLNVQRTFRGDFENYSTSLIYSFSHVEPNQNDAKFVPNLDGLSDIPHDPDDPEDDWSISDMIGPGPDLDPLNWQGHLPPSPPPLAFIDTAEPLPGLSTPMTFRVPIGAAPHLVSIPSQPLDVPLDVSIHDMDNQSISTLNEGEQGEPAERQTGPSRGSASAPLDPGSTLP